MIGDSGCRVPDNEWIYYESAGGWKICLTAEKGERTSKEDEVERTASGARIETDEDMLAVRQRYRGQSGVEQVFVLRAFSLLHASQHVLADSACTGADTSEERPVNMKITTAKSARLTIFEYIDRMALLYSDR